MRKMQEEAGGMKKERFIMKRATQEIREYAAKNSVYLWEIALALGISEPTMTRKLRTELPEREREMIIRVINELAAMRRINY